jgi:pilus assembly protein Flp/PilA
LFRETCSILGYIIAYFLEIFMNHLYQRGQGLVEYAMIMVLVAIIVIIILALFGSSVGNMFSSVIAMF